jgi:hypothetical protein
LPCLFPKCNGKELGDKARPIDIIAACKAKDISVLSPQAGTVLKASAGLQSRQRRRKGAANLAKQLLIVL